MLLKGFNTSGIISITTVERHESPFIPDPLSVELMLLPPSPITEAWGNIMPLPHPKPPRKIIYYSPSNPLPLTHERAVIFPIRRRGSNKQSSLHR